MKDTTIIIGGGLAGVATLFELARRGVAATLLEARDGVALETSRANGGMMTPSMSEPWSGPGVGRHLFASLFEPDAAMKLRLHAVPGLAVWGLRFLRNSVPSRHRAAAAANYALAAYSSRKTEEWRVEFGLEYDAANCGSMKLLDAPEAMATAIGAAEQLAPLGLRYQILDADRTVEIEPQLADIRERIAGAIHYPDDRMGDAHLFTRAIADKALKLGADIRTGVRVLSVSVDGGRIAGVTTDRGAFNARSIILAAGNASAEIAHALGVHLPIKPVKGYSLTYKMAGRRDLPRLPVIDEAMHAAVAPIGDRLRAVGTAEFAGDDRTLRQDRIDNLRRFLKRLYPSLSRDLDDSAGEAWAGLRPMSADGTPFIGDTRVGGLWVNSGHGHLGWTMAAGSASLIADLILGARPAIDPSPYRVHRPL